MDKLSKHKLHKKYGTAKAWYTENETIRDGLEQEWRDSAQLTLPYVFPVEDQDESSIMPTPYNSIGPSAVNVLASKLLLALLPPTGVFFRLLPNLELTKELAEEQVKQLDSELSQVEQDVVEYINQKALRVPTYEAIKLLIVTGNAMIYKVPNGGMKVFSPYQYTVQRDYVGNLLVACIKEKMSKSSLPEKVQKQIEDEMGPDSTDNMSTREKEVDIYTMIVKEGTNKFTVFQETCGFIIEGSEKSYTEEKLPYIILRWTTTNNENYGRGLVQQYIGDLRSLEGLTQTIVEGAGISAMHLFGLRPGSTLKVEDLNNAQNGEFVLGDLEREVSTLQVNKTADLQSALQMVQTLEQRLAKAFLMFNGQVRDSERTTALEVRATAAELEATLGGVFSVLANEFQTPIITLILNEIQAEVLKLSTPSITTGISAISREKDFNNLNTMMQTIAQFGPEVAAKYLNMGAFFSQIATSLSMDAKTIVKSEEQIQQEEQQQQMQQQQMMQQEANQQMQLEATKQGG